MWPCPGSCLLTMGALVQIMEVAATCGSLKILILTCEVNDKIKRRAADLGLEVYSFSDVETVVCGSHGHGGARHTDRRGRASTTKRSMSLRRRTTTLSSCLFPAGSTAPSSLLPLPTGRSSQPWPALM